MKVKAFFPVVFFVFFALAACAGISAPVTDRFDGTVSQTATLWTDGVASFSITKYTSANTGTRFYLDAAAGNTGGNGIAIKIDGVMAYLDAVNTRRSVSVIQGQVFHDLSSRFYITDSVLAQLRGAERIEIRYQARTVTNKLDIGKLRDFLAVD